MGRERGGPPILGTLSRVLAIEVGQRGAIRGGAARRGVAIGRRDAGVRQRDIGRSSDVARLVAVDGPGGAVAAVDRRRSSAARGRIRGDTGRRRGRDAALAEVRVVGETAPADEIAVIIDVAVVADSADTDVIAATVVLADIDATTDGGDLADVGDTAGPAGTVDLADIATVGIATVDIATAHVATVGIATADIATADIATVGIATVDIATLDLADVAPVDRARADLAVIACIACIAGSAGIAVADTADVPAVSTADLLTVTADLPTVCTADVPMARMADVATIQAPSVATVQVADIAVTADPAIGGRRARDGARTRQREYAGHDEARDDRRTNRGHSIFPGFMMPSGSIAALIARISASSFGPL